MLLNRTEWSPIRSVRFQYNYNHEYNYRPNWTTRNSDGFLIRRAEKVRKCDGAHCPIIGDLTITKTSLKKRIWLLSVFIAIIPTHLLCQMSVNPPGIEFQGTISKFKKRNKISSFCLFMSWIKCEISHFHVGKRAKKCTKSVMQVRSCCFAYKTYCFFFFDVLVAVRVVGSLSP